MLFFAHIYPVCGSKVRLGHGIVLITAVELRDLCVCVCVSLFVSYKNEELI